MLSHTNWSSGEDSFDSCSAPTTEVEKRWRQRVGTHQEWENLPFQTREALYAAYIAELEGKITRATQVLSEPDSARPISEDEQQDSPLLMAIAKLLDGMSALEQENRSLKRDIKRIRHQSRPTSQNLKQRQKSCQTSSKH